MCMEKQWFGVIILGLYHAPARNVTLCMSCFEAIQNIAHTSCACTTWILEELCGLAPNEEYP